MEDIKQWREEEDEKKRADMLKRRRKSAEQFNLDHLSWIIRKRAREYK